ncbi:MAG TPA: hypothetical protein VG052_08060, partial [Puia sp.]|nr:hypothetical protein [Puia sp.]
MRRISSVILFFIGATLLFSCSSTSKMSKNYVPFTRDLKAKLEKENIDLKEVQFYIDQKLVLSRNLGDQKVEVKSGVVKLENGKYINDVIIPPFTPGICNGTENDRLMISFEKGNNDLAFGPGSGYTFNDYVLYGTEWKDGTAAVTYDSNKFRARCGTCSDVASATLVIRKKELDKMERKSRVLKGRTVS